MPLAGKQRYRDSSRISVLVVPAGRPGPIKAGNSRNCLFHSTIRGLHSGTHFKPFTPFYCPLKTPQHLPGRDEHGRKRGCLKAGLRRPKQTLNPLRTLFSVYWTCTTFLQGTVTIFGISAPVLFDDASTSLRVCCLNSTLTLFYYHQLLKPLPLSFTVVSALHSDRSYSSFKISILLSSSSTNWIVDEDILSLH